MPQLVLLQGPSSPTCFLCCFVKLRQRLSRDSIRSFLSTSSLLPVSFPGLEDCDDVRFSSQVCANSSWLYLYVRHCRENKHSDSTPNCASVMLRLATEALSCALAQAFSRPFS